MSVQGGVEQKLFHKVLLDLVKKGELEESGPNISSAGFSASMASDRTEIVGSIERILDQAGFEPPRISELAEKLQVPVKDIQEILGFLSRDGKAAKISNELYLSKGSEEILRNRVREFILANKALAPNDMKTIIGVSRKYAIPYLEYLDRIRMTMRVGDVRKLAAGSK